MDPLETSKMKQDAWDRNGDTQLRNSIVGGSYVWGVEVSTSSHAWSPLCSWRLLHWSRQARAQRCPCRDGLGLGPASGPES